ncbi:MAG TPA: EAL domain-containing protein [Candidatus Baltobacteraceae bacterium]|jgi:diguanylate cyclase (GGDEF)-like protein|nr:EAL domain-containing protein [Candidatus Baltobacteraceae bacterium]
MVQPPAANRAAPFSAYPWYAIGITALAAAVATVLLVIYGGERASEARQTAVMLQASRLQQNVSRVENNLAGAIQVSAVAMHLLAPLRDPAEIRRDVLRILAGANSHIVSGVGVFYAPYAFNGKPLDGFYADRGLLQRGTIYVLDKHFGFNYPAAQWYRDGIAGRGELEFTGPYFAHGHTFVSAERAFYQNGAFAGEVLVDSFQATLVRNMRASIESNDVAYVTNDAGKIVFSTSALPLPGAPFEASQSRPIRGVPWTLHFTSDFSATAAKQRQIWLTCGLAIALLWCLTAALILNLIRTTRYKAQTIGLRQQSAELQIEIAARVAVEKQLRVTAYHDSLTGLPNRAKILETLRGAIAAHPEQGRFAVLFIDLDQFAVINDSLGHTTGDTLLQHIARRISQQLPQGAVLARLGGDEFVVYAPLKAQDVHHIATRILETLRRPFTIDGRRVYTGASIGVVLGGPRYVNAEELLRDADIAMYRAKEGGRGRFVVFDEDMHERALQRLLVESALRSAIQHSEFSVRYQPIISIATGEVCGIEALCRWDRPEYGEVGPVDFIPIAEQTGAITEIDSFVLGQACLDARRLQRRYSGIPVSVNVSATRLTHPDLVSGISRVLFESGLDAASLQLEITETALMGHTDQAIRTLSRLRDIGVRVVIDDFGAGYSSLSYVQRLPIWGLKIDRSFVHPMASDTQSAAIVRAIVALAKTLGLHVTAEGVETLQQLHLLTEMAVDSAQGFYFSPAVPFEQIEDAIRSRRLRIPG